MKNNIMLILLWNVYSIHLLNKNYKKFKKNIYKYLNDNDFDILCLQEAHNLSKSKKITLKNWKNNIIIFSSANKYGSNPILIYHNNKFKRYEKIFRIDTNKNFDFENFDIKNLIKSKSNHYTSRYTKKGAKNGTTGGRPLLGVKLIDIKTK